MEIKMTVRKVLKTGCIAIVLAFAAGFIGQFARAEGIAHQPQFGIVDDITQNYEYVTYLDPVKVCKDMEIPIYGEGPVRRTKSGDLLLGMILGGITGKAILGNDKGAVIGAVGGSLIANDKASKSDRVIVGYKQERRCSLEHREVNKKIATDYNVEYSWNGIYGTAYTTTRYSVGDKIPITVNIDIRR
jgi:uncharacterized protein YcfJ